MCRRALATDRGHQALVEIEVTVERVGEVAHKVIWVEGVYFTPFLLIVLALGEIYYSLLKKPSAKTAGGADLTWVRSTPGEAKSSVS